MSDDDPYRGTHPTRPKQAAVKVDADAADEGAETMQRCPLCIGHAYVRPEIAAAFEAYCKRLEEKQ